jgi:hypothetical protein
MAATRPPKKIIGARKIVRRVSPIGTSLESFVCNSGYFTYSDGQ